MMKSFMSVAFTPITSLKNKGANSFVLSTTCRYGMMYALNIQKVSQMGEEVISDISNNTNKFYRIQKKTKEGKMRKFLILCFVITITSMFLVGSASAVTYTFNDIYANWPGHFINANDEIGTPKIHDGWTVTVDSNGYLEEVKLSMTGRRVYDGLFINTNWNGTLADYESWEYYIKDCTLTNGDGGHIYQVGSTYTYAYSTNGRTGHPGGMSTGITELTPFNAYLSDITWTITDYGPTGYDYDDEGTLTYAFKSGKIYVGDLGDFVIGYTPSCANDNVLTPVPEPTTVLLLGLGLLGLGLGARKRTN